MILYASRTGTRRNLDAMRAHGWRLLVSAAGVWRNEGFPYAIDNGAWTYFAQSKPFDGGRFLGLVEQMGSGADWIVLPDAVGDGAATSVLTDQWLTRLAGLPLLAVIQDGADERSLDRLIGHVRGFFLGGSTEYKLGTLRRWGEYCKDRGVHYHVGRVNTERRIKLCASAGAHSCDGTSATRFAVNVARLSRAARNAHRQMKLTW